MARVIDLISYSNRWTHRYPDMARFGDGIMVILDPRDINDVGDLTGVVAAVKKPDGSIETLPIHHAEVHHNTVGLFFQGIDESRIPRNSEVTWVTI
jgi:hypothetical protein